MAKLDAEKIYGPAEAGDPVLAQQQLNSAVLGVVLMDLLPNTEAPQEAWNQFVAPVAIESAHAPVIMAASAQINAPRAAETVQESPYARPEATFLPVA